MGKNAGRHISSGPSYGTNITASEHNNPLHKKTPSNSNPPRDVSQIPRTPTSNSSPSTSSSSTMGLTPKPFADPIEAFFGLSTPYFFLVFSVYTLFAFSGWSVRWWISGTPLLCFLVLYGALQSDLPLTQPAQRLPYVAGILAFYTVLSTSWLAYYILTLITWPLVVIFAIANSTVLQRIVRRSMHGIGRDMHYFRDKIACFDLPALDIDVRVNGMMVIEGMTFTLSTLTIEAHSIEVALKVDEGLEICFRTEKAIARLGRCVEIGDVYITLKTEMDTGPGSTFATRRCNTVDTMTNAGRQPENLHPTSLGNVIEQVKDVTDTQCFDEDEDYAIQTWTKRVQHIYSNTAIHAARMRLQSTAGEKYNTLTAKERKAMMASALQTATSITHPPTWSIAVSQLKARTPAWIHEFNNRFPLIQRTILNIIAHLHPVKCNGVIGNITGLFSSGMLQRAVFKHYKNENKDISKLASRIQTWLETGNFVVQLSKINGIAQVPTTISYDIVALIKTSTVQVFKVLVAPDFCSSTDCLLDEDDAVSVDSAASNVSNRSGKSGISVTIKDKAGIKQEVDKGISEVARFNGVSATVEVPSLLLPHHEYLFPPPPEAEIKLGPEDRPIGSQGLEKVASDVSVYPYEDDSMQDDVLADNFDGRHPALLPQPHGAEESTNKETDEVFVVATVLASLPAQFNSTILHFATALLKASKLIEIEKGANNLSDCGFEVNIDQEDADLSTPSPRSRSLSRMGNKISATMKRTFAGAVDDAWIARLVGRLVSKVEGLKGEIGYKMPIAVDLKPRRLVGLGPKGTAADYGLFSRKEVRELWPDDNPYRRNC
ncbi:hypothetical protein DRE_01094 [Drechslerella stenobrocha 248]|uniref:Uncharacterized protein n=1 Tax=Drechslerella stenobrocha 248 TaxID=1043628 RepID=W7HWH0_9PEZI|nr:hypothetical protein DRE_01094 [Drechslerella stenobrocha 248]